MICESLANLKCFPRVILNKKKKRLMFFKGKERKLQRPYWRQEDKKRNISKQKSCSSKSLIFQRLSNIERLHQPDTSSLCLSNTTKSDTISSYIHIVYFIVTPLCFNKLLFIVTKSFSGLWVANARTCSHRSNDRQKIPINCIILFLRIFQKQQWHRMSW